MNPILPSTTEPAPSPATPAGQPLAALPEPLAAQNPDPRRAAERQPRPDGLPHHIVRYDVHGGEVTIRILDASGRLVRTVPSTDMVEAILRDNLRPPQLNLFA